jgi:hypothetical protein
MVQGIHSVLDTLMKWSINNNVKEVLILYFHSSKYGLDVRQVILFGVSDIREEERIKTIAKNSKYL